MRIRTITSLAGFNSSMVQLKEVPTPSVVLLSPPFQFLYGTIKRNKPQRDRVREARFNSSMVQLKAEMQMRAVKDSASFNSSMVQLKGHHAGSCFSGPFVSIPLWYN